MAAVLSISLLLYVAAEGQAAALVCPGSALPDQDKAALSHISLTGKPLKTTNDPA